MSERDGPGAKLGLLGRARRAVGGALLPAAAWTCIVCAWLAVGTWSVLWTLAGRCGCASAEADYFDTSDCPGCAVECWGCALQLDHECEAEGGR